MPWMRQEFLKPPSVFFSHGLLSDISTASDISRGASGVKRQRNVQVFNERVRERIPVSQHSR